MELWTREDGGEAMKPKCVTLTGRHAQIARLVSRGKLNKEIAYEIGIAEGTVKVYVHEVYNRLGMHCLGNPRMMLGYWVQAHPDLTGPRYDAEAA